MQTRQKCAEWIVLQPQCEVGTACKILIVFDSFLCGNTCIKPHRALPLCSSHCDTLSEDEKRCVVHSTGSRMWVQWIFKGLKWTWQDMWNLPKPLPWTAAMNTLSSSGEQFTSGVGAFIGNFRSSICSNMQNLGIYSYSKWEHGQLIFAQDKVVFKRLEGLEEVLTFTKLS